MAVRKPLFMDQIEGYSTEMATTDEAVFGGLAIGIAGIDMQNNRIINVPLTPSADQDAASKAYVDAVAQGLVVKTPVKVVSVSNVASLSGVGGVIDSVTLAENDRVLLTAQSAVPFSGTGDSLAGPFSGTGDSLTFSTGVVTLNDTGAAFVAADVGKRITISGASNPGNNGTFVIASRASATQITFNNASGVTETSAFAYVCNDVRLTDSAGAFATTAVGQKIILSGCTNPVNDGTYTIYSRISATDIVYANASGVTETSAFAYTGETGINGGIWQVKSGAWIRPVDFASGAHAYNAFCFVQSGTIYADTGWVQTEDYPDEVIDTNKLTWVQFSSAGVITAGAGLQKVGNVISVKKGDGIEVTSNSASTNVALSGTNPCLALVGTAGSKTLEAQVVAAGAGTGGIEKTATGLQIDLDGTTLQLGAGGISVKGVPNLFEIGGTATSQTPGTGQVTAANLNTLTAGASSNADALHQHTTGAATEAPKVENTLTVGIAVLAADPVYFTNTNNRIAPADTTDPQARVIGVARTGQSTPGNTCEVVSAGPCAGILTLANAGDAYYLKTGTGISTSLPLASKRVVRVGYAINASDLWVEIMDFGKKA